MTVSGENRQAASDIPDKILKQVSAFPSMPKAAVELRSLLSKEDASVDDIEKILRHDPGLAANVLRLANSAFFGMSSKVTSLKQAVVLLGTRRFAKIAFGACMNKNMDAAVAGYGLSPGELWLHSIAVATTAVALAKNRKFAESKDFFTPALLHDLGKLVLGQFVKAEQSRIDCMVADGVPVVIAEREVLKTDHAEIGALILAKWSFPDDLISAVWWHHYPDRSENSNPFADIIYLANLMCHSGDDGKPAEAELSLPYSSVLDRLGIQPEQYEVFAARASEWLQTLSETLSFD